MKSHKDNKTAGYALHGRLLVPGWLADQLANEEHGVEGERGGTGVPAWSPPASRDPVPVPEPQAQAAPAPQEPRARRRRSAVQLFQPTDVARMEAAAQSRSKNSDRGREMATMLAGLARAPIGERSLVRVPRRLPQICAQLRAEMPNFAHAIDFIERHLLLQRAGDGVLRLPPLLLGGPPGVGKTYFASRLAAALGAPCEVIGMETTTAPWVLTGMSLGWASAGPGRVFERLVHGEVANPFLVLNEIDKATTDSRYPAINALYALLEPGTAREFRDEACPDVPLDARHINWITTANEVDRIPPPVRSRLTLIEIPEPTPSQRLAIAQCVHRDLRQEHAWGKRFEPVLDPKVARALSMGEGAVREVRALLLGCFALAYTEGRRRLLPADVAEVIRRQLVAVDLETVAVAGHA